MHATIVIRTVLGPDAVLPLLSVVGVAGLVVSG
jgi:hypothetical protein